MGRIYSESGVGNVVILLSFKRFYTILGKLGKIIFPDRFRRSTFRYNDYMNATKSKRRYQRHPWAKWFAKKRLTLRRGIEYTQASYSMANSVRNAAAKRGFAVSIAIKEQWIEIEVSKKAVK